MKKPSAKVTKDEYPLPRAKEYLELVTNLVKAELEVELAEAKKRFALAEIKVFMKSKLEEATAEAKAHLSKLEGKV